MEDRRAMFMDLEHSNSSDPGTQAMRLVSGKQGILEERPGIPENASVTASPADELRQEPVIEAVFSQGGRI